MADFIGEDLQGARFERATMTGATFERVDLSGASIRACELNDVRVQDTDFIRLTMKNVALCDVDITGELRRVTINGVEIAPLVEAELDRRYPDRVKMRPTDADGFREAWALLETLWAGTVERARRLDPALLHESVNGEWSFIETLRHLAYATDAWVRRAVQGEPSPWDPLDLPWDDAPPMEGVPHDRTVRPSLDEALALRMDRMVGVRDYLAGLTDDELASDTEPVPGDIWPPSRSFPVRQCLLTVLNEEWNHRMYAERDLALLEERLSPEPK